MSVLPAATARGTRCPGCGETMRALTLARSPHGDTTVDLCDGCRALWFDAFESVTLTAGAIIALFREVNRAANPPAGALPSVLRCPRCSGSLATTQDMRHATRFSYWRCLKSHGRFTPFVQFLREKDFVRPLTPRELARLKAQVAQVRCSGCGAPVDLAREMVCGFCRAPLEVLDPDAVAKALATLDRAEEARGKVNVDALADAILAGQRAGPGSVYFGQPADLLGTGLELLIRAFDA